MNEITEGKKLAEVAVPNTPCVTSQTLTLVPHFAAFITTLLHNASVDLWVGLTSDSRAHFQWAKPSGLLSYTNWAPGEPLDNSGPHHNKTRVPAASKLL